MLNRWLGLILVLLGAVIPLTAQERKLRTLEPSQSSEGILLLTLAQPDAPVQFDRARLVNSDTNGLQIIFDIRNVGTKPVRRVTPAIWTSFGTGGTLRPKEIDQMLLPGQFLANDARTEFNLSGSRQNLKQPIKALVVLLVEEVTFGDGSSYSGRITSKALLRYFEELADNVERLQHLSDSATKRQPK